MKKCILTLGLCLSIAGPCFAQNNIEAMRFLTVNALVQYGQKLHDRGDFNEACAVFDHVLTYDGHQAQALEYLKEMGHLPSPSLTPVVHQQVIVPAVTVKDTRVFAKSDVPTVDVSDTAALKEAIEAKKKKINKLRDQIMQMRMRIVSESAQE
jgi:hypothetical protein